jgi:hypothetical protein
LYGASKPTLIGSYCQFKDGSEVNKVPKVLGRTCNPGLREKPENNLGDELDEQNLANKLGQQYNPESASLRRSRWRGTASGKSFCIAGQVNGIKN